MTAGSKTKSGGWLHFRNLFIGSFLIFGAVIVFDLFTYNVSVWLLDRASSAGSEDEYFERSRSFIEHHPYRRFRSPFQEDSIEARMGLMTLVGGVERDPALYRSFQEWLKDAGASKNPKG